MKEHGHELVCESCELSLITGSEERSECGECGATYGICCETPEEGFCATCLAVDIEDAWEESTDELEEADLEALLWDSTTVMVSGAGI